MERAEKTIDETGDRGEHEIVEGELLEVSSGERAENGERLKLKSPAQNPIQSADQKKNQTENQTENRTEAQKTRTAKLTVYLLVPFIFLTVALLGGLRLSAGAGDFIFLKPALICLVFAAILLVLFFRANLIRVKDWFSDQISLTANLANACVLLALFAASTQIFNALLPENGLPFWVVAFCFFWTLWNNLFAEFDTAKLLKSLGGLFCIAFAAKYLILANLTVPASENSLQDLWENPARETFTRLLDLPRFSAGTGYIQFFTLAFYLIGLFLIPQNIQNNYLRNNQRIAPPGKL